jgi:hypothetical protein
MGGGEYFGSFSGTIIKGLLWRFLAVNNHILILLDWSSFFKDHKTSLQECSYNGSWDRSTTTFEVRRSKK